MDAERTGKKGIPKLTGTKATAQVMGAQGLEDGVWEDRDG
jgi:hypothetical protein